ncbi:MAG: hypothetical protein H6766_05080 [Candidatus Peribacteria bacterium]|nr:MAG: hypothetical protein H6766_05080 [Candidatus Peribacteria bacterium]
MPLTPQAQYRISVAGSQPEQQSHADVQALVDADTAGISVMSLDQTSGWQAPSAFGIVKKVPDAPTAPQAPKSTASNGAPAAPTAPTISQSREPGTIQKIFTKSSTIADRLLS